MFLRLIILWGLACVANPLFAQRTAGFQDPSLGLSLGAGTYFHALANDNKFDPAPALAPSGAEVSDSDSYYLLPAKIGLFLRSGRMTHEVYYRHMLNIREEWSVSGSVDGSGFTTFRSHGVGANIGASILRVPRFQINAVLNGEYIWQRARIDFIDNNTSSQLHLRSQSLLAGVGLQPEIWLGDLWVLSLFGGYQYGFLKYWDVAEAGSIINRNHNAGPLLDSDGQRSRAQFGGFLVEASLKLNFYN